MFLDELTQRTKIEQETRRRRRVLALFAVPLALAAVRGVVGLSTGTVSRMQDLCRVDLPAFNGYDASSFDMPCHPANVAEVASWRVPGIVIALCLVGVAVAVLWKLMPRITTFDFTPVPVTPLRGRLRRGRRRYRMNHVGHWGAVVLGVSLSLAGLALLALPSGAPVAISASVIASGALMLLAARSGTAISSSDGLKLSSLMRSRRWGWDEIASIAAVQRVPARGPSRRLLVVRSVDSEEYTSAAFASPAGGARPTRADRLALTLEMDRLERGARDRSSRHSSPFEVRNDGV